MNYLDCAQYDCCHNKAGCCCLDGINVRHTYLHSFFIAE